MPIAASVNYHVKSRAPQAFRFDAHGIAGNLLSPELIATNVMVEDLRDREDQPNFADDGICFVEHKTAVHDFEGGQDWQTLYGEELQHLLKTEVGASEVIVFDHTVRTDDPDAIRRPARNVHNDYNRASAEQRLIDIVGPERSRAFHQSGFSFVNVWRPIDRVVKTSPLGFIRPRSVDPSDWMDIGLIYPDRVGQILGVAANNAHEWFFKSEMVPDEAVIFNIYSNLDRPQLAHSALDLLEEQKATAPRKSIESRTLVRF